PASSLISESHGGTAARFLSFLALSVSPRMLWRKPRANAPFGPSISVTLPTMARQNGICRLVSRPVGRRIGRAVSAPASDRIALMDRNDANGAICPVASCIRRTVGQTVLRAEFFVDSRKRPRQISRRSVSLLNEQYLPLSAISLHCGPTHSSFLQGTLHFEGMSLAVAVPWSLPGRPAEHS